MLTRTLHPTQVLINFLPHALLFGAWAGVVVTFHTLAHYPQRLGAEPGMLARAVEALSWSSIGIPFAAIAALGGALAIFLGFRNSSAYDRWWEARKIWGALVNDSRSWCRQVVAWVEAGSTSAAAATALKRELVHRHIAFVHGLRHHLRGERTELLATMARLVPADESARYAQVPNVPTALLIEQGKRVASAHDAGQIERFRHIQMDGMLTRLSDIQGKCERIKNTPVPRQYDAFPRWFAYFYGLMLPFGLVDPIGWGAVPVSACIVVVFIALEASGRIIEDPFENTIMDTPMTALAITIERDLRAALDEPVPPAAVPDKRGVLM